MDKDLFAVFKERLDSGKLPVSCTRADLWLSATQKGGFGTAEKLGAYLTT